ncbi:MAG: sugar transferase [Salibacteraceae bacterium]|nr:sugar transferase [Salibacteraceae bacterium]
MVLISSKNRRRDIVRELSVNDFPGIPGEELEDFLSYYLDIYNPEKTLVLSTADGLNVSNALKGRHESVNCIINLKRINDVRWINKLFETTNRYLPNDGVFVGCVETYGLRKKRLLNKFPPIVNYLYYTMDYTLKRVFPKLPLLKNLYLGLTQGRNRSISMSEAFGRLYYSGFKIVESKTIGSNLYFVAQKTKEVKNLKNPTYGPVFKMKRAGKGGKLVEVYKFRSMHAYSEFLQQYVYELNNLQEGGKINNDFRITSVGKFMRKFFLDEVPMLINVLKGDLKLVGVRPISMHYLSLYDNELRMLRRMVKPGLVPPFYADMPKTLDDIILSEKKYIKKYLKNPLKTDIEYFIKAFKNIIIKKARSK